MNEELLISSIVGGLFVLLSYAYLYYDSNADNAWGGIEGQWRLVWFASTALTTVSYIFLWACFCFIVEEKSMLLLASWLVFLVSASQWVYLTLLDLEKQRKSLVLLVNLVVTATGSLGIWAVCLALEDEDLRGWMLAASTYMFLHHAIADAWLWYAAFPSIDFVPV
jgi:hypothetical protein